MDVRERQEQIRSRTDERDVVEIGNHPDGGIALGDVAENGLKGEGKKEAGEGVTLTNTFFRGNSGDEVGKMVQ